MVVSRPTPLEGCLLVAVGEGGRERGGPCGAGDEDVFVGEAAGHCCGGSRSLESMGMFFGVCLQEINII